MRRLSFGLLGGLVLSTCLVSAPGQQPAAPGPATTLSFDDDFDSRHLADIRFSVVQRDGAPTLEMTISAVGPEVEPIPAFPGVRGANLYTAEQFENILKGRFAFAVKTYPNGSAAPVLGTWRAGRSGTIPERRVGADGRIDVLARTRIFPLELIVETRTPIMGRQKTEIWYAGIPRLRVGYEISANNELQVVSFENLPFELAIADDQAQPPPEETAGPPPVTDAEWNARDLEGKWVIFQKISRYDAKKGQALVAYAAKHKEHELLEMVALNSPFYGIGSTALRELANSDAPQWIRVAAWLWPRNRIGHGESELSVILTKLKPGKVLAWLDRHLAADALSPEERKVNPKVRSEELRQLQKFLREKKVVAGELGNALPPLQSAEVFKLLDAGADLAEFGDRERAEPGKVYVHQVIRAMQTFVQAERYWHPWTDKMLLLTRHANLEVRRQSYLSFTYFAAALDPRENPMDEFRRVMDDAKETPAIRESALLAFSYFRHPQVEVRLLEMTRETDHPAWQAAVSRVYDVSAELFTLKQLGLVDRTKLSAKQVDLLDHVRKNLLDFLENSKNQDDFSLRSTEKLLERAAWAGHNKSPLAGSLIPWTKSYLGSHPKSWIHVEQLAKSYEPAFAASDPAALSRLVRGLAEEILVEAGRKR